MNLEGTLLERCARHDEHTNRRDRIVWNGGWALGCVSAFMYTQTSGLGRGGFVPMYERWVALRSVWMCCVLGCGHGAAALLCVLSGAFALCTVAQETVPNLLMNPSFEEGVAENGVPSGWTLYGGLDEQRKLTLIDTTTDGAHALQLDDGHPGEELGIRQAVAAEGGTAYVASVSVRAVGDASPGGAYLQLRFSPSNVFVQRALVPGLAGAAADVPVGMIAPPGTTEATVYLYSHRGPTPSVIVDEVSLQAVAELPAALAVPTGAVVPEIEALKPLYLATPLVAAGKAISIVVPTDGTYDADAAVIADAIETTGGLRPALLADDTFAGTLAIDDDLIVLGNRSTNRLLGTLYERYYTLLDLRYPGPGGHVLRTLHNPLGNGKNVVLVGGSDGAGVSAAAVALAQEIADAGVKNGEELLVGHLMKIQPGAGIVLPTDLDAFETWDASAGYRSVGYFGWNSISKRMAMYYMTGDEFHAREVIRLAFPDEQAKAEIAKIDGERIENKDAPLSGPYHYNAHLMAIYWDLIEESPVFTDDERLNVTRALAKQLEHPGIAKAYLGPYAATPGSVGSRHGQWTALSLYTLGRYFAKDYDDPIWPVCEENGAQHFRSLHDHAWVIGESDNLFWYNTAIAPVLQYMMLTGDRVPLENGVLATLLRGQEILASGREGDWALKYGAISFYHQAADLTQDGRWLEYRRRMGIDTDGFRLGQSWWPAEDLAPVPPADLVNTWQVLSLPEPMWQARNSGIPLDSSFQFMSYRSAADASGDFLLLDGYNGASRNPYHTFAILELRRAGQTLLAGYLNQIRTRADGLTEPVVAMDAALLHQNVLGDTAVVVAEVPNAAYTRWRRNIVHRNGRYTLVADTLIPRIDTENFEIQLSWEFEATGWQPDPAMPGRIVLPNTADPAATPTIQTSRAMPVQLDGTQATLTWTGPASSGQPHYLISAIGVGGTEETDLVVSVPRGSNAAALRLPEVALLALGSAEGLEGELVLVTSDFVYGRNMTAARELLQSDAPMDVAWNLVDGHIDLVTSQTTAIHIALDGPEKLKLNRAPVAGTLKDGMLQIQVEAGRHRITGAPLDPTRRDAHRTALETLVTESVGAFVAAGLPVPVPKPEVPEITPTASWNVDGAVVDMVLLPSDGGNRIAVAAGNTVYVHASDGTPIRTMTTDGPIRMLRYWDEHRLLLAGCADEKVIAFDDSGARAWEFVSEMDPAVFRAAKTYWFKSAPGHEGIHGLHTGVFLNGESQAFVGSACTLEILDGKGQLIKRMPQFWGKVSLFKIIPTAPDTLTLLAGRSYNGSNTLGMIDNRSLNPDARGFHTVPEGHSYIGGWSSMNRHHLFFEDFDDDGTPEVMSEINGSWNRVTVWDTNGTAKYDASFGPGDRIPAKNIRDIDIGDLDGDGLPEIIVAEKSGLLVALEGTCERKWGVNLGGPPVVMNCVTPAGGAAPVIFVALEDGTVLVYDGTGALLQTGTLGSKPVCMLRLGGGSVVLGFANGNVSVLDSESQ